MYSVLVKIEGIEKRRRNAGLMHLVIGFFLLAKAADYYRLSAYKNFMIVIPFLLIASLSLFYGLLKKRMDRTTQYNGWLRLLQVISFAAMGMLMTAAGSSIDYVGSFVFALLSALLFISEKRIFADTTIYLVDAGIRIPGYYRDQLIPWSALSEMVVREDFITLFHVRQKYIQFQVMQDLSILEVAKMNAFCREKIEGKEVEKKIEQG